MRQQHERRHHKVAAKLKRPCVKETVAEPEHFHWLQDQQDSTLAERTPKHPKDDALQVQTDKNKTQNKLHCF